MADDPPPPALPAATLVLLREAPAGGGGPPEILMVERASAMAFAAGALVFPGGRVDPGDREAGADDEGADGEGADGEGADGEGAARVAAIRETIEEVGIATGLTPPADAGATGALRRGLAGGATMAPLLAAAGLALDPAALVPFARWRPAHRTSRVYDTRFYLARLPAAAPPATVDGQENVRLFWASAAATLAMVEAGEASVIYPTRRNLERLARFATVEAAFADARAHPIRTIVPWIETRGGTDWLCIPEGLGYPVTAEPLAAARRG